MGLAVQRHSVIEYAAAKGFELAEIVEEAASGGVRGDEEFSWEHRPVLLSLVERAGRGEFEVLIVAKLDRLSRDYATLTILERRLQKYGVEVLSAAEENGDGPIAEFVRAQLALVAQLERAMILDRISSGKAAGRREGRRVAGTVPFGYRPSREPGQLKIEPAEAEIVRAMFLRARQGVGPGTIASQLNAEGVPGPRGRLWHRQTVTNVLRNTLYAGELHGVRNAQPEIVSRRAWNAAQR
jgi:DNA invertase Pin-like site-specific DNA recombinase